jgi:hypothetical protein
LPFVPRNLTPAPPGRRLAAYLLDWLAFLPFYLLLDDDFFRWAFRLDAPAAAFQAARSVLWPLYFFLLEGASGGSLGKRALRLRVAAGAGVDPPGWWRVLVRTAVFFGVGLAAEAYSLSVPDWNPEAGPMPSGFFTGIFGYLGLHALDVLLPLSTMRRRNGYRGLHELLSGTRVVALPAPEEHIQFPPPPPPPRAAAGEPARVGPFAVRGPATDALPRVLRGQDSSLGREVVVWLRPADDPPLGPRADTTRPTRLRWLAGGSQSGARWDAFLAPAGQSLAALAAKGRRLDWAQARQLLKQLAVELGAAAREGSLPARLSEEQIWLQPEGQVKLLEVPLDGGARAKGAASAGPAQGPLDLLARAAVLALEGRPRPAGVAGPVRAPVPPHAARLLARLVGPGPRYRDLAEFEADLEATRELPRRVSRARRAATLVSWAAVNAPGLALMLLVSLLAPAVLHLALLTGPNEARQWTLRGVRGGADITLAASAVHPELPARLQGAAQWQADNELLGRLDQALARRLDLEDKSLPRLPVASRWLARAVRGWADEQQDVADGGRAGARPDWLVAMRAGTAGGKVIVLESREEREMSRDLVWLLAGLLLIWPAAAVVAAFVGRGGLGLRMHGLTLVRSDGRRAGRFRCAWRCLVLWAPLAGLLAGAVLLYARAWSAAEGGAAGWGLAASSLCWWAGLVLLPLWAWLALRSPERGWHDRLAGTYLVPR